MEKKKIDWNLFSVFIEVYRLGSITTAAEVLNMTQPGVSNALKRLQENLGVTLFIRKGRGIAPTVSANLLAEQLEMATGIIDQALDQVLEFDPQSAHKFHVTLSEPIQHLLLPLLKHPKLAACELSVSIAPASDEEVSKSLIENQTDLVVDLLDNLLPSFSSSELFSEELVMVISKDHPLANKEMTPEEYFSCGHIVQNLRRAKMRIVDYFAKEKVSNRTIVADSDSMLSAMAMASRTHNVTIVTQSLADMYAETMGLNVQPLPFKSELATHHLIWHKRAENSPAHRWLRKTVGELLQIAINKENT
ncbi:LysR family transcriptional regulator [Vibrio sp. ZSDE26]|uniref:LysR family transcriptional regulator n=1 Tax=Vibrio amylolyticus TaxID=2847292 RepID=A0A9X1XHR5_9VIBR|nr:LysR family transcriptional regulator [Vibrio amylolyticus]MCK6262290.1 LysR family transcriptional regulator [Vibrio amylolyticus]